MIAPNGFGAEFTKARNHIMRIGSVADDITKTHGNVPAPRGCVESSGESCGVCVQITQNKNAH
jgi:hypothetical protein